MMVPEPGDRAAAAHSGTWKRGKWGPRRSEVEGAQRASQSPGAVQHRGTGCLRAEGWPRVCTQLTGESTQGPSQPQVSSGWRGGQRDQGGRTEGPRGKHHEFCQCIETCIAAANTAGVRDSVHDILGAVCEDTDRSAVPPADAPHSFGQRTLREHFPLQTPEPKSTVLYHRVSF